MDYLNKYLTVKATERPGNGRLNSDTTRRSAKFFNLKVSVQRSFAKLCSTAASIVNDVGILRS